MQSLRFRARGPGSFYRDHTRGIAIDSGHSSTLGHSACQKGLGSGGSSVVSSTTAAPAPKETAATATATTRAMIVL